MRWGLESIRVLAQEKVSRTREKKVKDRIDEALRAATRAMLRPSDRRVLKGSGKERRTAQGLQNLRIRSKYDSHI